MGEAFLSLFFVILFPYYVLCLYAIIQIWKSQIWINRLRRIKYGENHLWKTVIMV